MKRIVLSILFTLFLAGIYAQDYTPWRFGLKVSPNISWFNPEIRHMEYKNVDIGFSYGLFGDKHFAKNYAISSGFFITHQGGEIYFSEGTYEVVIDGTGEADTTDLKIRKYDLQYIDVPLTLKLRTRKIGYFTYYGQFGASFGFNIRARADDEYHNNTSLKKNLDISDFTNLFKASLIMGAGFEYSLLGNTAIVIGLYYNNGFINPLDMGSTDDNRKISTRANFVELTIGMVF